MFKLIITIH